MWEHKNAYRFDDGSVMGFKGIGSSKEEATENAMKEIRFKVVNINNQDFKERNVITSMLQLSREEFEQVRADWKTYRSFRY